jgi:hypothetical protein
MMTRMFAALSLAGLLTLQQDGSPPPDVGPVIYEESLTESGVLRVKSCPTGQIRGEVVGDGFLVAIRGRCADGPAGAAGTSVIFPLVGLTIPDGELSIDFKVVNGYARASMVILTRGTKGGSGGEYAFALIPDHGYIEVAKEQVSSGDTTLAVRRSVTEPLHRDDWNTLAVRMRGSTHWLLINGQSIVSVEDSTFDSGDVYLGVARQGNPNDDQEVAIVFRNLRISAIAGAPDDRNPTYSPASGTSKHGTLRGFEIVSE